MFTLVFDMEQIYYYSGNACSFSPRLHFLIPPGKSRRNSFLPSFFRSMIPLQNSNWVRNFENWNGDCSLPRLASSTFRSNEQFIALGREKMATPEGITQFPPLFCSCFQLWMKFELYPPFPHFFLHLSSWSLFFGAHHGA